MSFKRCPGRIYVFQIGVIVPEQAGHMYSNKRTLWALGIVVWWLQTPVASGNNA